MGCILYICVNYRDNACNISIDMQCYYYIACYYYTALFLICAITFSGYLSNIYYFMKSLKMLSSILTRVFFDLDPQLDLFLASDPHRPYQSGCCIAWNPRPWSMRTNWWNPSRTSWISTALARSRTLKEGSSIKQRCTKQIKANCL